MRGGRDGQPLWVHGIKRVPSIEAPGVSVLDEYYWLNKLPLLQSLSEKCSKDAHTDKKFASIKSPHLRFFAKLFWLPRKTWGTRRLATYFLDSFWNTNLAFIGRPCLRSKDGHPFLRWRISLGWFWVTCWRSAWTLLRCVLPSTTSESMILPLVRYLENHGVSVDYGMDVKNHHQRHQW